MTHPVQRGQNTPFNYALTVPPSVRVAPQQRPTDSLRTTQNAQGGFSFKAIWDAIVNCFTSCFGRFFNSTQAPSNTAKDQIARIAARDHFVWFYKQQENPLTAFLGNFHPCRISYLGFSFRCAEAAYQAAKFHPDRRTMQRFENLDGEAAWQLGRQLSQNWTPAQRNQWQQNSVRIMREVVYAKFCQNADLAELLLATGNAYLVEHTPVRGRDAFWADDHNGTGQNWLGRIAMETRGSLGGSAPVPRNQQYNQFISRQ
jgi:ribA/ribD-fused uncharacterized protein